LICASGSILEDGGVCVCLFIYLFIYSPGDGNEMVVLVCLFVCLFVLFAPSLLFFFEEIGGWGGGGLFFPLKK